MKTRAAEKAIVFTQKGLSSRTNKEIAREKGEILKNNSVVRYVFKTICFFLSFLSNLFLPLFFCCFMLVYSYRQSPVHPSIQVDARHWKHIYCYAADVERAALIPKRRKKCSEEVAWGTNARVERRVSCLPVIETLT